MNDMNGQEAMTATRAVVTALQGEGATFDAVDAIAKLSVVLGCLLALSHSEKGMRDGIKEVERLVRNAARTARKAQFKVGLAPN